MAEQPYKYTLPKTSNINYSLGNAPTAKDLISQWSVDSGSNLDKAFIEGASNLGENVFTGLALTADKINGSPQDNKFFRSLADEMRTTRENNMFQSGYDQAKVKKQLMDGDILGAMDTIGFAGTVEEFVKSAPYMIGYTINPSAMMAASSLSYAVDNAKQKKELAHDTTPLTAQELFNPENVINGVVQGVLDRIGFGAEKAGFKTARNVAVRQLITTDAKQGMDAVMKLAKAGAMGLLGEGATEATQQYLQESYARDNYASILNDKDAQANILFAGTIGGLVGGQASLAGFGTDMIGSDVKSMIDTHKKDKSVRQSAAEVYSSLPEDVKSTVSQKDFVSQYKEEADAESARSNASVTVNPDTNTLTVEGIVDNKIASYDPITDTVEAIKEDGTKEAIEVKPEQKEQLKAEAVYETVKDLDNESIIAQQEMWKALGFDTETDTRMSGIIGSKIAENDAKATLEQTIETVTPDTAQIINDKLMVEIAGANATKLEAMLNRQSMFGLDPEARLSRITSKWKKNKLTPESKQKLIDFMTAEKDYAIKRLASLKSVSSKPVEPKVQSKPVNKKQEPVKQKPSSEKAQPKQERKVKMVDKLISATGVEIIAKNVGGEIQFSNNQELWDKYYTEKRWTKPREQKDGSYAKALPEDVFDNVDEFKEFIYQREKAHDDIKQKDGESKGDYETRVNDEALKRIGKLAQESIPSTQTLSTKEDISDGVKLSDIIGSNKELSQIVNSIVSAAKSVNTMFAFKYNPKFPEGISNELIQTNPIGLFADSLVAKGENRFFQFSDELIERIGIAGLASAVSQSPVGTTDDSKSFVEAFAGGKNATYKQIIRYGGFGAKINAISIGKAIASEAGIKLSNDVNKLVADDAYASLGYASLFALEKAGYLESFVFENEEGVKFEMFKLTDKAREFNKHSKSLKGYMKEHIHATPIVNATEDIPVDDNIRNSNVRTSAPMKQALKTQQSKKYKLNKEMFDMVEKFVLVNGKLNDDRIAEFIGQPSTEELSKVHTTYREDKIAARTNAINEFKNSYHFFKSLSDGDTFSYKHFITVSGRVMTDATGGGDFQNDKHFSRFVIDYIKPDGSTEYKVTNRNYKEYIFGVLQGFDGVLDYVSKPDKKSFKENKAVFARILTDFSRSSDEAIMKWATSKGIHAMRAARGFIQGRKQFNPKTGEMTGKSFNSDIMFEVDGITNGLFHNILQSITSNFGSAKDAQEAIMSIFKRVGIYDKAGMTAQSLSKGILDTYETVADRAASILVNKTGASVDVFKLVFGEISRKFAKSPTMIFNYGAGDFKIRRDVGESVLEKLIDDLVSGKLNPNKLKGIKELSFAFRIAGKPDSDMLSDREYNNAVKFLSEGVGDAFSEAMGSLFPSILSYNENVYRIASSIRRLIANSDKFKKKIAELNSPDITIGRYKQVLSEIERMFPKYNVAWSMHGEPSRTLQSHSLESESAESTRTIKMYVDGKLTKRGYDIKKQTLEAGMPYLDESYKAYDAGDKSRSVTMTHNIDGAIVNDPSIASEYAQQIFDAMVGGVGMIDTVTTGYNRAGFKINTQFSNLESMLDSLKWMLSDNMSNENLYPKELIDEAKETINFIESTISSNADLYESTISSIESVGQMSGYDGGQWDVEPEIKKDSILKFKNRVRKYAKKEVGSSSHSIPKHKVISEEEFKHDEQSILNTFDELGQYEKPENTSTLKALIGSIVNNLGKPMSGVLQTLKVSQNDVETIGNFNRDTASIHVSVSENIKNRQYMTAQEVYAHELVHLASEYGFENSPSLHSQVRDLMLKTKQNIDKLGGYEYFMEYLPDGRINAIVSEEEEIKAAKEKYEYIFSNANEFFTYGLTNASFSKMLSGMKDDVKTADNMFDRLLGYFDILMSFISEKLGTHVATSGDFKNQLNQLSVKVFAANRGAKSNSVYQVAQDFVDSKMDKFDKKIMESMGDVKKQLLNHSQPLARAVEGLGRTAMFQTMRESRLARSVFNELIGGADRVKPILKLMRTKEVYQKIYNDTRHELAQHLKERIPATDTQEVAIQMALIDTDIQSLGLDAVQLRELLANDTKLNKAIFDITAEIEATAKTPAEKAYINYVVNQANGLGYFLAKGIVAVKRGQMLNAQNIVSAEYYTGSNIKTTNLDVKLVDKLASLYAIKYTEGRTKAVAASYIESNEKGINELMELMREYNTKTAPKMFSGEKHLMIKGYSKTMVDRDVELDAVPYSEVKKRLASGWKPVVDMKQSGKLLMKRYNPEVKFTEGIMDTEQAGRKGTMDTSYNPFDDEGKFITDDMNFLTTNRFGTLNAIAGQYTLPLLHRKESGVIVGYRFVANKKLRAEHLNQDYRFSRVIPDTFAMTQRSIMGKNNNRILANMLVNMMRTDMPKNKKDYVAIVNDGATKVMYRMIPSEMRHVFNRALKGEPLYVHKDILENVFGYKNMSVKNIEYIKSSDKVQRIVRIGEKVVEDVVGHIRKNVVFKTKEVVVDNIISNFITLVWRGLSPIKAIKYMDEGRMLMNQYRKDVSTVKRQEALRDSKSSAYDKTLHLAALNALQTKNGNPVVRLVKAGQFQSIIDDIDVELENNRNIVESFGNMLKDRLPKHLQFMIDILYINENTRFYKFIMKLVQYSDFVARYAYYKFATQEKGMKPEDAIDEVEDMFVNYSLLQDRHLQYASDIGMFMFSKYFLRIQRMIARGFHKNPSRGVAMLATQKMFGDVSDISDSFIGTANIFGRVGANPTDLLNPHLPEWFL